MAFWLEWQYIDAINNKQLACDKYIILSRHLLQWNDAIGSYGGIELAFHSLAYLSV